MQQTKENVDHIKHKGESFREVMKNMGKLSLGKIYLHKKTSVDVDVSKYVMDKASEEENNINDKITKFFDAYAKLEMEVCRIGNIDLSKKKHDQHVGKNLNILLRWKVQEKNERICKQVNEKCQQWKMWKDR